jgi:leader peptidase (prepilin peptidase) / N-methyltransferase
MVDEPAYQILFSAFAFVLGATVGSFLNVCIYRLPRDLSVNQPRRSFCPNCNQPIPWYYNIPLISWLFLRARCANCGGKISFRYFGVELLTALLFLAVWKAFPMPIAVAYWVFVSLVIVATFVDFEHFIIPDEITIGGTVAGIIGSVAVPALQVADTRMAAFIRSALAAALGYVALLFVLEAGKIAFGKKRIRLDGPTPFTWKRHDDDAEFAVGSERSLWSEHFARETDRLLLKCDDLNIDGQVHNKVLAQFHYNRVTVEGETLQLDEVNEISGTVTELQIPREAMGRGDLKFLACIGAFLGWRAVLFSIFAGSLVGSVVGLVTLLAGKRVWSSKLPFGPYLALGALSWMFFGPAFVEWYLGLLVPR